jgi:riboflavin kinase / FMN adenylyltransferase
MVYNLWAMRVFERYDGLPPDVRGAVLAIGNFDGVHRGHAALLDTARAIAKRERRALAALTFEPHPRAVLRPDDPPARLTPPDLKRARLAAAEVGVLFSLPFDWDMASRPPVDFAREVIRDALGAAHVVVGGDFRFGQMRAGTPFTIRDAGLPLHAVDKVCCAVGAPISASRIRALLRHGDMDAAAELLGWRWELWGQVVHGDARGRTLGYPTANVALGTAVHPAYGVYAGEVLLEREGAWRPAALNIGIRPMFAGPGAVAVAEAHILDWEGDIYGERLRIRPVKRLRGEARFENLETLTAQMARDCAATREAITPGRVV